MSTGLYTHTTRATGTVLTAAIYNADHVNHITNQNPQQTGGYSDNVAQMQTKTNPGGVGSESLATNIAGELERIRFQINAIVGLSQWYQPPATNLQTLAGAGVADNSITNAKLADMAQATIKARTSGAGTGDPQDLSLSTVLDFIGTTNGDLLFRTGGVWGRLGIGSASQVLTVSSGLPAWVTPPSSGIGAIAPQVEARTASATITIPTNATKLFVLLVGAGGGSGGCAQGGCPPTSGTGGSGGGGGALLKYLSGLTPGNTLSLTIGSGGSAGTSSPGAGGNGGSTILQSGSQTITTLTASGGNGGLAGTGGLGTCGTGGTGTNGDSNHTGDTGNGMIGGSPGIQFGTPGFTIAVAPTAGVAGNPWGGGASGGSTGGSARAGAAGGNGGAIFFWFQ